jgi:hypothetical protein
LSARLPTLHRSINNKTTAPTAAVTAKAGSKKKKPRTEHALTQVINKIEEKNIYDGNLVQNFI